MHNKMHYFIWLSLFLGLFTAFSAFAAIADEDRGLEDNMTFHVYDDVDLVSTLKFEYGKPRIVIKSVYPQLVSETPHDGVYNFNELALQIVNDEIAQFRNLVKDNAAIQKKMDKKTVVNNLYIDYNTSSFKPAKDHIISIRFSIQGYVGGNKHPYHKYVTLNYNLDKNQRIELNDLFLPGSNYLNTLSEYSYSVLYKRLGNKSRSGGAAPINENFMIWNMKPNGILITFGGSQVAPRGFGTQTILVPYSALTEIISPDAPIANCLQHPSKCRRNNLLTGGFIDEARNTNTSHGIFNPVPGQLQKLFRFLVF